MFSYVFMKILEARPASYDRAMTAASQGRIREVKEEVAAAVAPGSRVLDVGCGTGELASMLVARGCTVVGFDGDGGMVRAARARIAAEGLEDRFAVSRMGVDGMDGLPDAAFDGVTSTLVFSELSGDERRFALRHCARVLRPGGLLILADEVVPRTGVARAAHGLVRAPALAATYLVTGAVTRPVDDLAGEVAGAGLGVLEERRSHGDAFAVVIGRRDGEGASP